MRNFDRVGLDAADHARVADKQPLVDQMTNKWLGRFWQSAQALDSSPGFGIGVVEMHKRRDERCPSQLFELGMAVRQCRIAPTLPSTATSTSGSLTA